jgi:CPW-WPC domain-containing protein
MFNKGHAIQIFKGALHILSQRETVFAFRKLLTEDLSVLFCSFRCVIAVSTCLFLIILTVRIPSFKTRSSQGTCAVIDLTMSSAQKLAWATSCLADFPCQDDCEQDFDSTSCPSFWKETSIGVCHAPTNSGFVKCAFLNITGMTTKDKLAFGARCGVSWPCRPSAPVSNYRVICPDTWKLGYGKTCYASPSYEAMLLFCASTCFMLFFG